MTAKEYLLQYKDLTDDIAEKQEKLGWLETVAASASPGNGSGGGSEKSDKVGRLAADIADLKNEINQLTDRLISLREEIELTISQITSGKHRKLLHKIYISGKSWPQVEQEMSYCNRHLRRIHREALDRLDKILAAKDKDVRKCP